ncbi:XRE family transcriptional regulator [Vagococcus sp. AM17-17]|nr:XRE family transcriptional regulator [Vagococcus sp. AM17-17]
MKTKEIDMNISDKLKNNRKQAGLTQEEIAQTLHVSRQTISNWETGRSIRDIYSLVELSNIYDISLDHLVKEDIIMMNELKKENKEKKIINRAIISSAVGVILMIISSFIKSSHIQDFSRGFGMGLLLTSAIVLILTKVLRGIYK